MNRAHMENKCWKCFGVIQEEKVRFQEKQFHPKCFFCETCKTLLKNKIIQSDGGKLYCKECFSILSQDKCSKCKTIIREEAQSFKGKLYHMECFTCQRCRGSLVGMSFHDDDGDYFCEHCFKDHNAYVCNGCNRQIDGNDIEFMLFQGKYFHNKCFACQQCNQSLQGQKFKMMMGQRYCTRCR